MRCYKLAVPVALLGLLMVAACGDEATGPFTGTLRVTTSTTGSDLDPDGYSCIAAGYSRAIGVNETVAWDGIAAGDHTVELTGLAGNCVVSGDNPRTVLVTAGQTVRTTFEVTCSALTGALQVTTVTTGDTLDWDGYELILNGSDTSHIEINDGVTFADIALGEYSVELNDVAVNCTTGDEGPRSVQVTAGETAYVRFEALCAPALFDYLVYSTAECRVEPCYQYVELLRTDGSNKFVVDISGEPIGSPDFSPDGTKIAFTSNRDGNSEIYVTDPDGRNLVRLTTEGAGWPDWSPDGKRIAFSSSRDGNGEIYVMNADGSEAVRITNDPGTDWNPVWSPDGSRIAFVSNRDGNQEIYVMDADGSAVLRLTENPSPDSGPPIWRAEDPSWSPDGSQILYESGRGYDLDLYVMNADGSNVLRLTDHPDEDYNPSWSPDGAWIAFNSYREGGGIGGGLYRMNPDGTNVVLVKKIGYGWMTVTSWSPMTKIHR